MRFAASRLRFEGRSIVRAPLWRGLRLRLRLRHWLLRGRGSAAEGLDQLLLAQQAVARYATLARERMQVGERPAGELLGLRHGDGRALVLDCGLGRGGRLLEL